MKSVGAFIASHFSDSAADSKVGADSLSLTSDKLIKDRGEPIIEEVVNEAGIIYKNKNVNLGFNLNKMLTWCVTVLVVESFIEDISPGQESIREHSHAVHTFLAFNCLMSKGYNFCLVTNVT